MSGYVGPLATTAVEASDWSRERVIATNLRAVRGRAYPRVTGSLREKSWVFFEIFLPLVTTVSFVLVYRALQAPEAYVGFVVLGGAMTAFWLNVIWMMAAQLYWERDQGNLELYFTAPISMMSILFGMAFGGFFMAAIRAAVVIVIGTILFDVRFGVEQWALVAGVFLLTLAALYGLGMLLASLFLMWGREAYHLTQLLEEPMYFFGGLYAPIRALGQFAALAVGLFPLAVGLDAMRQLVFPGPESRGVLPPGVEIAILAVMAVVLLGLANRALALLEWLARREGRLTVRWR